MDNKNTGIKFFLVIIFILFGTYFIYLAGRILSGLSIKKYVINFFQNLFISDINLSQIKSIIDQYIDIRFLPDENFLACCLFILGISIFILSTGIFIKNISENENFSSSKFFDNRKLSSIIILFSLIFSLVYLFQNFNGPISRFNSFKQTEVASNIYHYVNNGFGLKEYLLNDNEDLKFFSFPFYQWTAALICKLFNLQVEQGGRLLNILIFFFTYLLFFKLIKLFNIKPVLIALVLFIFSTSPLVIYYYRSVHPDPMAIFFSYLSLYYFIVYEKSGRTKHFLFSLIAAMIACLIKNPIYLMIFVTILYYRLTSKSFNKLLSRDIIIYTITIVFIVIFYKFLADYLNNGLSLKTSWIFGTFDQRISLLPYFLLFNWLAVELINPLFFLMVLLFFIKNFLKYNVQDDYKKFNLGLFWGMFITILIFFNVFQAHDYYHLPFVFIFSSIIVCYFYELIKKFFNYNKFLVATSFVVFIMIQLSWFYFMKFPLFADENIMSGANFIKQNTEMDSYIFYTVGKDIQGWDPTYLFNSRRQGFNICLENINKQGYLDSIINKYAYKFERIYLYIPKDLESEFFYTSIEKPIVKQGKDGILMLLK